MSRGEEKAKRWRPWQFGLRTLATVMICVACFFGGWAANEWKHQRELDQSRTYLPYPLHVYDPVEPTQFSHDGPGVANGH